MNNTVNWGIDLGTTNSAIARMTPKGPEVIPVERMNYVASAVAIDKRGDIKVGLHALNPHLVGARWFKRLMGTTNTLPVGSEAWTPERLSSEVLKALRAAAKLRRNQDIEHVVITVPAMFSQPQCAATNEAARLAGLNAVSLLQEPIAAATAHLSDNPAEGHYLVYDLGGGTFDVSLIKLQSGEMSVVEHGGDNYLGGSDFDRAVFDWLLNQIDRRGGDVRPFETDGWQRTQLLLACEEARVAVSDGEVAPIHLDAFELPIAKLELSRETVEDLVSGLVTRTIEIATDRLKGLGSSARAILLVGGPTQMPYVRKRLQDELGLPLSLDHDPMTVVAEGAAVHASTLLIPASGRRATETSGVATLFLNYEPVSPEDTTVVAGKVTTPADFRGEVRLRTADGLWESGWRALIKGAFSVEVNLGRGQITEYEVELRDMEGRPVACSPAGFSIRSGVRSAQPVTPYNYGVVRKGGKVAVIVRAGEPLPASGNGEFQLSKTIVAGSPDEVTFYLVEGHSAFADENTRVGSLTLRGSDISRTLKEGEKVQVRVRIDESRRGKATIHIPLLDEDYLVDHHSVLDAPDIDDLVASLGEARNTVVQIEDRADDSEQDTVMRAERQLEQIEASLLRVEQGEIGEAERVHKQLADVKASLRPLKDKYGLQARHDEVLEFIEEAEALCRRFGDNMGLAKLQDARDDAGKALRTTLDTGLESVFDRVRGVFWEHYGKTRECWERQVRFMRDRAPIAKDPLSYYEYVKRAEKALAEEDYEGVRLNALRARDLLPDSVKSLDRFHDAAIR